MRCAVNGKRGVSPETALRLARTFVASARFWLNLQTAYELAVAEAKLGPASTPKWRRPPVPSPLPLSR